MYSKVVIFMCAAGIASAGNLLAAAPLGYNSQPALSTVSFSSHSSQGPNAYFSKNLAPVATYASARYAAYNTDPVVANTYATPVVNYAGPAVNYAARSFTAYSTPGVVKTISNSAPIPYAVATGGYKSYSAPTYTYSAPVFAKTLSPSLSYSSISQSAPTQYAYATAAPVLKTVSGSAYSSYSAPTHTFVTKNSAPAVSYSSISQAPVNYVASNPVYSTSLVKTVSPAVQTYAPVVNTAHTYSSAPAVSHVSYPGLGTTYGW